jgi:5,10-methylenetetrahydrofolate reductase
MSALRESLESGRFTVTGEVGPPKGVDIHEMLEDAEHLRGKVAAINVTDIQSAVMRVSCLAICIKLREMGLEPVLQMVCRDRNRLALQSDLLGAAVMGIENVLSLTGDHTTLGDHKDAKPVFDLDSVSLLHAITTLMSGKDLAGLELKGSPKFFPGAVVTPCSDPVEPQLYKMEKKVAAGAKFFQTQAVYSAKSFEKFMKRAEQFKVPVLVGIVLLKNAGMAKFMNDNVAGVVVPKKIVKEIGSVPAADRMKKSAEIGARLIREMKGMCQGAHIMPLGWDKIVPDVIAQAGLS